MKVYIQKSEDEVRRTYLEPLSKATGERPWSKTDSLWCPLSECRLFSKIIEYKPAGISRKFHLLQITDFMNNVYEDEDLDFEELLSPEDFALLKKRKESRSKPDSIMVFKPKYKIRPSAEQVLRKINETWNMGTIEINEGIPTSYETITDFVLPEAFFTELSRRKEDGPPRKRARRGGSPDSLASRCSTPGQRY